MRRGLALLQLVANLAQEEDVLGASIAALSSVSEKNCRSRKEARIQRSRINTLFSTLALSRGLRTRAGRIATP